MDFWLSLTPTVESLVAQALAVLLIFGSYSPPAYFSPAVCTITSMKQGICGRLDMQNLNRLRRRVLLQSLALFPAAADSASEKSSPLDDDRAGWNRVYTYDIARLAPNLDRFLAQVIEGRKPGLALDVGMGQGRNSFFLGRLGWDVTGVDIPDKGIELAEKEAARLRLKIFCVLADIAAFDIGKTKWDLIVDVYVGHLILLKASRLAQELTSGGQLLVEQYHRDIGRVSLSGGQLGYPVNALLETFIPALRIVQYKGVLHSPDWRGQGERASLVRMLSGKGYAVDVHIRRGHP
ncbi:MAG TPA: methyltransferase domain-containing protein [Terriglobia bacterium]|nr:methyltransferase domain-containing protein [Terriglobia bacterium]